MVDIKYKSKKTMKNKHGEVTRVYYKFVVDGKEMAVPVPPSVKDTETVKAILYRGLSGQWRKEELEKYEKLIAILENLSVKGGDK